MKLVKARAWRLPVVRSGTPPIDRHPAAINPQHGYHGLSRRGTESSNPAPSYPCGEGRLAVGGVRMRDAGLELELAITQDRCLTRLPRYWARGTAAPVQCRAE